MNEWGFVQNLNGEVAWILRFLAGLSLLVIAQFVVTGYLAFRLWRRDRCGSQSADPIVLKQHFEKPDGMIVLTSMDPIAEPILVPRSRILSCYRWAGTLPGDALDEVEQDGPE